MQILLVVLITTASLLVYLPKTYADDASEGRNVFIQKCIACHAFACNKQGPRLSGLFGRKAGGVEDYGYYTEGFKSSEIVWTDETLDGFFEDPSKIAPQSVMVDNGKIEDATLRRQLISFLKTEDPTINICPQ